MPGVWGVVRPLIVALTYVAVGELFGGSPNPDPFTNVAVGELFGGSPNPDPFTNVAVGELFGGSLSTSVLLEELVEFGGGGTIERLNRVEIHS